MTYEKHRSYQEIAKQEGYETAEKRRIVQTAEDNPYPSALSISDRLGALEERFLTPKEE